MACIIGCDDQFLRTTLEHPPRESSGGRRAAPEDVVADGGACEGRQIIPAAWINDIVQNGSADAWDAGVFAPFFPGLRMHYRNKWYADLGEAPLLFALGIHGQYLFVDRRNQLAIVMMSSQANPLDAELISLTMTAVSYSVKFSHSPNRRPRRSHYDCGCSEGGVFD